MKVITVFLSVAGHIPACTPESFAGQGASSLKCGERDAQAFSCAVRGESCTLSG
ncbi:hypothetical protein [Accumulibacter sp.]|uniref:hypothetical protein n=1 Tax=Accumulibacter sp. TaxID=2053492 RepID=UPI002D0250FF|nr:hypothetical protein [Accumulibacter sp.]HRF04510.1 hypothetical protein [Accumulibacter sp.]